MPSAVFYRVVTTALCRGYNTIKYCDKTAKTVWRFFAAVLAVSAIAGTRSEVLVTSAVLENIFNTESRDADHVTVGNICGSQFVNPIEGYLF